jgi:hypothetical protein
MAAAALRLEGRAALYLLQNAGWQARRGLATAGQRPLGSDDDDARTSGSTTDFGAR